MSGCGALVEEGGNWVGISPGSSSASIFVELTEMGSNHIKDHKAKARVPSETARLMAHQVLRPLFEFDSTDSRRYNLRPTIWEKGQERER
ncbi:uncharacterized protein N7518_009498 [Penicillium psychrosexuale]|uniref:uncharacterized protein n=1 Tax=Penicillium psychrosexuale TaxID=1002107 RepID=UPI002545A593|nr:uncharacterized protein N7518_009498 [Penicillium psychrosexuale]KAJ5783821.1 hypothetical protein N7518_009498 [Penicillium psychrosexuale]